MTIEQALNSAATLAEGGRTPEAERLLLEVLARQPKHAEALHMLGVIVGRSGRLDRSIELLKRTVTINPADAPAFYHLGIALGQTGRYENAIEAYRSAIQARPDFAEAHCNLAMSLMLLGDFERGLPEYEWRGKSRFAKPFQNFRQPRWDGSPLDGKTILLTPEQGLGDTIQFARYAPLVAARGARVLLALQSSLLRVLKDLPGVDRQLSEGEPVPAFDVHCSMLSLPLLLGTRVDSIPATIPYVWPDPAIAGRWADRIGTRDGRLRVGLVWAGSPTNNNDAQRSVTAARFAAFSAVRNVQFYSLQTGTAAAEAGAGPDGIIDFSQELTDFAETAALIAQLDLVISVDTSVVHLAGAMGKPVWALLPFSPDWRWLLNRTDSPWYPTLRLFRQRFPGDWDGVIAMVTQSLESERRNG